MLNNFTPYYVKRLDTYQEIIRQEKRNRGTWKIEKMLLIWAATKHNHLMSPWAYEEIKLYVQKQGIKSKNDLDELQHAIKNLEAKNLADTAGSSEGGSPSIYRFTEAGLLQGEILSKLQSNRSKLWLWFNLRLVNIIGLLAIIALITTIIYQLAKLIIEL